MSKEDEKSQIDHEAKLRLSDWILPDKLNENKMSPALVKIIGLLSQAEAAMNDLSGDELESEQVRYWAIHPEYRRKYLSVIYVKPGQKSLNQQIKEHEEKNNAITRTSKEVIRTTR